MLSNIVGALSDPNNIITGVVGILAFLTIVGLASPMMKTNNLDDRLKSVANRREELRRHSEAAVATIWLVFYVLGLVVAVSSPIVSRALEFAAH